MKRNYLPKQANLTWIVTSGARYLSPTLNSSLASIRLAPRPVNPRPLQRPYRKTRQSLTPLFLRPAFVDR